VNKVHVSPPAREDHNDVNEIIECVLTSLRPARKHGTYVGDNACSCGMPETGNRRIGDTRWTVRQVVGADVVMARNHLRKKKRPLGYETPAIARVRQPARGANSICATPERGSPTGERRAKQDGGGFLAARQSYHQQRRDTEETQ